MARSIKCPHCGQVMKASEQAAGKRVNCPACKKPFLAPRALATPAKPAQPASRTARPGPAAAKPAKPERAWYVHIDGRNDGPHTLETIAEHLKTGRLDAQTLAWRKGMADWVPLAELGEFKDAAALPPPVRKRRPAGPKARDDEHARRAHYSRSKARRDVMVGFWVAGGLALVALVVALIILGQRDRGTPTYRPTIRQPAVVVQQPPAPSTPLPPGTRVIHGPRPVAPPTKRRVAQVKNERLMARLVADMDRCFKAAIVAHTKGNRRPIYFLARTCRRHAENLAERDWGAYKGEVESVIKRLKEAADAIEKVMKEETDNWDLGEGLDEKQRAESLGLYKFQWLQRWQQFISDEIAKVRKKGMEF